jgi:hypothetical protein
LLAALLNIPHNAQDWSIWSYNNYDCNNQIRQAIATQKSIILPEYQLDPIPPKDLDTWLDNNQQAHIDFTGVLGLQSNDLLHTDFRDPNQLAAWIWLNYNELLQACQTLKIGP